MAKEQDVAVTLGSNVDQQSLNQSQSQINRFFKSMMTSMNKYFSQVNSLLNKNTGLNTSIQGRASSISNMLSGLKTETSIEEPKVETNEIVQSQYRVIDGTKEVEKQNLKTAKSFNTLSIVGIYAWRLLSRKSIQLIKTLSTAGSRVTELNSRFSIIMKDMTSQAEEFATALSNAYGLNEAGIKENMLRMYTLAQNAGLANQNAMDLTKTMSRLAVEVASVWDVPIDQAYNNLISGLQGLPRAMKKYGSYVGTEEIKEFLNQYRRDRGLEEITGELTRQQKVLGVYLKSLSDLGYAFGDFERTSSSVANQTRILSELVITLQQEFGQILNTVLGPLLKAFNYLIKGVQYFIKPLSKLPNTIKWVIGAIMLFVLTIPLFVGASMLIIFYVQKMRQSWDSLIASQNVAALTLKKYSGVALTTAKTLGWLSVLFISFITVLDLFGVLKEKTDDNTDALKDQTTAAKTLKRTLSSFDDVNIFKVKDTGTDEFSFDLDMNSEDMQEYLGDIGLVSEELNNLNDILGISEGWLKAIAIAVGSIAIFKLISGIKGLWTSLSAFGPMLLKLKDMFAGILPTLTNWMPVLIALATTIYSVIKALQSWGDMTLWQKIATGILVVASALATYGAIKSAVAGNYVKAAGLSLVAAGASVGTVFMSDVPKAAHGGTVSAPTLVETGEGKYSEAIIPLGNSPEFSQMKSDITNAVLAGLSQVKGGNNQPINITINVDEEYIYESYNRVAKQNGER